MIIGLAGHVDHGKSALVTALTGRPMDRLPEEQRRGISIDLNFAALTLTPGVVAGVVDVPGHEDFVRTMVAGASGIDVALLVIAADEGIMPQTQEHLLILEHLRIPRGIPVITKSDKVETDWLALVMAEAADWLATSPVRFADPIAVSSVTGQGVDALRQRLALLGLEPERKPVAEDLFRLNVDRVFTVGGTGTVVTGTALSGSIGVGDTALILPSTREVRIRAVESHGAARERSMPRVRTALALSGVEREEVGRGDTIVLATDPWEPTSRIEAEVSLSADAPGALHNRTRIRLHHGTAEVMARVRLDAPLEPGSTGLVRFILESPLVARGGDRLVIRSYSPMVTIGGGWIVDPLPESRRRVSATLTSAVPAERLVALVERRRFGVEITKVPVVLGLPPAECEVLAEASTSLMLAGSRLSMRAEVERLSRQLVTQVAAHHRSSPHETGLSDETLRQSLRVPLELAAAALGLAIETRRLKLTQGLAAVPSFKPTPRASEADRERLLALIVARGLTAPSVTELERGEGRQSAVLSRQAVGSRQPTHDSRLADDSRLTTEAVLRDLAKDGRITPVSPGWYVAPEALAGFAVVLQELGQAGEITPGALRDRTGLSRKYLIPLLEWADRVGITWREGEGRRLRPARKP